MRDSSTSKRFTFRPAALLCLVFLFAASAQAQLSGYPGKLVCGFEQGNVPFLNDPNPLQPPRPYENLKPGNYATVFNLLNLTATAQLVNFVFTSDNAPPVFVFARTINAFTSIEIGCDEVLNPFMPPLVGQRVEGMLIPVANVANLIVDVVYTFESQNGFERHVVYGQGGTSDPTLGSTVDEILHDFTPPTGAGDQIVAASGAGGLGLGASIDVVRLVAVPVPPGAVPAADVEPPFEP